MQTLDYAVLALFLAFNLSLGVWAARKVRGSRDFFVGGGRVPWWLAGISHHISGHSGVVFVAYAAIAYEYGFTLYVWWAVPIAIGCLVGSRIFAPRWARLRAAAGIESPTEYLSTRYNVTAQQVMAWSGILLKLFDTAAKWAAIGVLLQGFTGLPLATGILLSGGVSLLYITIGGLWADLYTDLLQFLVQVVAGFALLFAVLAHLGGPRAFFGIWDALPADRAQLFNGPYSPAFAVAFGLAAFLSYNGGTWNLAARYMSVSSANSAKKSATLSGVLYLAWPLFLFFPMWAAPLVLPGLGDPSRCYVQMTQTFLPIGFIGLVLASMFAATMSMTTSDTNTISSVITRDILPLTSIRFRDMSQKQALLVARISTFCFTLMTLLLALEAERFGGVLGLLISWFAALVGPVSIPMLLGLLPAFRHANAVIAIGSLAAGLIAFIMTTYAFDASQAVRVMTPIVTSASVYVGGAWLRRREPVPEPVERLMRSLAA